MRVVPTVSETGKDNAPSNLWSIVHKFPKARKPETLPPNAQGLAPA